MVKFNSALSSGSFETSNEPVIPSGRGPYIKKTTNVQTTAETTHMMGSQNPSLFVGTSLITDVPFLLLLSNRLGRDQIEFRFERSKT